MRNKWVVILVSMLIALVVLVSGQAAWATPWQNPKYQSGPPPETHLYSCPDKAGELVSQSGDATISVPQGAVGECVTLVHSLRVDCQVADAGVVGQVLGHAFTFKALMGTGGGEISDFTLAKPVQVCVTYTDEDLVNAGGDANSLLLMVANKAVAGQWTKVATTIDPVQKKVCGVLGFSACVVLGSAKPGMPVTGAPHADVIP